MRFAYLAIFGCLGCGSHDATVPDAAGSGGDAAAIDAARPETFPRLVIAGAGGVRIWNRADQLATDRAPDATLAGIDGGALGLAASADTLYVTASGASALYRYASPGLLADGAMPASAIAATDFGGRLTAGTTKLQLDGHGDLWIDAAGTLMLVADAATATTRTATFTHPYGQIAGMIYDDAGDRLFGGQISGAGFLAWNAAAGRSGAVAASDFVLDHMSAFHLALGGGRLYASSYAPPTISVWNAIGSIAAPAPADVTLANVCGGGQGTELRYVTVTHDDVLIAIHDELTAGGTKQLEKVCLFRHASTLTATPDPDAVASDPALVPSLAADKAVLTGDGHLFVLDRTGVTIFADALGTPTRVTHIAASAPTDLVVLE